jgi:hypothetical protein
MEKKNITGMFVVLSLVVAAIVVITKIVTGSKEK